MQNNELKSITTVDGMTLILPTGEAFHIKKNQLWGVYSLIESYFNNFGATDELDREVMWPQHIKYKVEVSLRKELILITPMALTFGTMIYGFSQGSMPFILASMGLAALTAFLAIKLVKPR